MNQLPIITGTVILAGAAAVFALCLLKVSLYTKTAAAVLSAVAVCGIFFGSALVLRVPAGFGQARMLLLFPALVCAAVFDALTRKVPNFIPLYLLCAFGAILLTEFILQKEGVLQELTGGLISGMITVLFFLICRFFAKGGIGYGDVKLLGAAATLLGLYGVIHLMIFAELSALVYAGVGLLRKKLSLKDGIPFVPFILSGFLFMTAFGLM